MQTTIQIKLYPTKEQKDLVKTLLTEYINAVNAIVSDFVTSGSILKISSKNVHFQLPSALRGQCVLEAKSIFKKYKKACTSSDNWNKKHKSEKQKTAVVPILKKPIAIWNNQNWKVDKILLVYLYGVMKNVSV